MRTQRYYTIDLPSTQPRTPKQKPQIDSPMNDRILCQKNTNRIKLNSLLLKSSQKKIEPKKVLNRDSHGGSLSPYIKRQKQKTYLEELTGLARVVFQKMSLKQKLIQIQHVFKIVKQLCKVYGFFSVTEAMLQFNLHQTFKISILIHPDPRSQKPLHPIRRQTQFQCQLVCVAQLRIVIHDLFPTVDLGSAKTFTNIIAYLNTMKNNWDQEVGKSPTKKYQQYNNLINEKNKQNHLVGSCQNIISSNHLKSQQDQLKDETNRKYFKNVENKKKTTSTLLESIRSGNSIKQRIQFELLIQITPPKLSNNTEQFQLKKKDCNKISVDIDHKQKISSHQGSLANLTPKNSTEKIVFQEKCQQGTCKANTNENRLYMKTSINNNQFLSTSIDIQSEINNLFESTDNIRTTNYYSKKITKNSMLFKVAQEFEDLF